MFSPLLLNESKVGGYPAVFLGREFKLRISSFLLRCKMDTETEELLLFLLSICPGNLIGKWWAFHFVECAYIHVFKD